MQIHSDALVHTGIGGTSGTFNALTGSPLRTRDDAIHLLGAFVSGGPVTGTAAEAYIGRWEFSNSALGLDTRAYGPPFEGGAPATNVGHRPHLPQWIPLRRGSESNPIGQVDIAMRFTTVEPDVAVASAVVAALVYTATGDHPDSPIPQEIVDAYNKAPLGAIPSMIGGKWPVDVDGSDEEALTTVARSALPALSLDKRGVGIAGFGVGWMPDAFAAEEAIGFISYVSTIPSFGPQDWIVPGSGAPLGTAVGVGVHLPVGLANYPTWFPKKKDTIHTITPGMEWVAAVTTSSPSVVSNVHLAIEL